MAEARGYVVFLNFSTGRPANLIEAGEPYTALHAEIEKMVEESNRLHAEWEAANPKKKPSQL